MNDRRRQTDNLEDRMEAVEKTVKEQNTKIDVLITNTAGVIKAHADAKTWIRVTKWGSGVIALVSGAVIGILKVKGS